MKQSLTASAAFHLLLLTLPIPARELPATLALQKAANAFLASLDDEKVALAKAPFTAAERENWHFVPLDRRGLSLREMNDSQKNAAVALANAVLSESGALKAAQIITLESVLAKLENDPVKRDSEKYWVIIFGEPGSEDGWGFRFEGHHLSINITLIDDKVSVTPSFMGSNPAEVREGEYKGLRVLAAEEDLARALASTLMEAGKKEVLFSDRPPEEILTGQDRVAKAPGPVGVAAAEMTGAQVKTLLDLIGEYTGRYRADLAASDLKKISEAGFDKITFGWAGSLQPGNAFYYRVQGPTFLLEGCNTRNNANHMHTVWRDFKGDFGRDLLKEHMDSHEN